MKYDEVENTLPEFNTAELGLTPPSTLHVASCLCAVWHEICGTSALFSIDEVPVGRYVCMLVSGCTKLIQIVCVCPFPTFLELGML
jgi:hypothetical protein